MNAQTTNGNGVYSISPVPGCQTYTITPYRNDFPLNGVSTYDLVLITKHILGLEALGSPYKIIAADANKSQSVTTFDVVALRKLILGIDTAFTGNTSWRFVPAGFIFPNPANPFQSPFPETISVPLQTLPVAGLDFTALKVGDVNGTAIPSLTGAAEERYAGEWPLYLQNIDFEAGEKVIAEFSGSFSAVAGVQFSLLYDRELLEFERIEPIAPGLTGDNFGTNGIANGFLTACFENPSIYGKSFPLQNTGAAGSLFRIVFKARGRECLDNIFRFPMSRHRLPPTWPTVLH